MNNFVFDDDQIIGRNEILSNGCKLNLQLAPSIMKKDSETQFVVVVLAPGLVDDQIHASIDFIKEGEKPVLLIAVHSGQSDDSDLPYRYNYFEQYILLPEDVDLSTRVIKMQNGLFTCSFQRIKPIS